MIAFGGPYAGRAQQHLARREPERAAPLDERAVLLANGTEACARQHRNMEERWQVLLTGWWSST
jgi:hypothetical protein